MGPELVEGTRDRLNENLIKQKEATCKKVFRFPTLYKYERHNMANNTSKHILNTSANLLGFCLFVITSLHISDIIETRMIDILTSVIAIFLTFSCILSFISIRTSSPKREIIYETAADYLFVSSLIGVLVIILLITLNFIL